jgi:hypothetical protein
MIETLAVMLVSFGGFVAVGFFFIRAKEQDFVEHEGDRDADEALEDLDGNEGGKKSTEKKSAKEKKGKKNKGGNRDKEDKGADGEAEK